MKNNVLLSALTLALLLACIACQRANDKNPALLGQWQGREWLIRGQPSGQEASRVNFEFREDGTFTANFGNQAQQGVWRTDGDKLYTKATGSQEIMVKLLTTDAAVLKFEMNRGGQQETLEFTKVQ